MTTPQQPAVLRLLDANPTGPARGRVIEDWCRFGDRADLVARSKDMRQRLGRLHDERESRPATPPVMWRRGWPTSASGSANSLRPWWRLLRPGPGGSRTEEFGRG